MRKEIKFTHQEKRKLLMATLTVTLSISALFIGRAVQKVTYNNHTYPLSTVVECVNGNEITAKDFKCTTIIQISSMTTQLSKLNIRVFVR